MNNGRVTAGLVCGISGMTVTFLGILGSVVMAIPGALTVSALIGVGVSVVGFLLMISVRNQLRQNNAPLDSTMPGIIVSAVGMAAAHLCLQVAFLSGILRFIVANFRG